MAPKAEVKEQTVLLTNEQGKRYFSEDAEMCECFDEPDVIAELLVNVEEKILRYRVAREDMLDTATWNDDDFGGGIDVLWYMDVWDTERRRIGHIMFDEYEGIEYEVYNFPGVGYRVDVILVNGHDEDIETFSTLDEALDAIDLYYCDHPGV